MWNLWFDTSANLLNTQGIGNAIGIQWSTIFWRGAGTRWYEQSETRPALNCKQSETPLVFNTVVNNLAKGASKQGLIYSMRDRPGIVEDTKNAFQRGCVWRWSSSCRIMGIKPASNYYVVVYTVLSSMIWYDNVIWSLPMYADCIAGCRNGVPWEESNYTE